MDKHILLQRIDELLAASEPLTSPNWTALGTELLHGTTTLLALAYGPDSPQLAAFRKSHDRAYADERSADDGWRHRKAAPAIQGSLRSLKADVEAGLIGNLRREIAGEVIGDFLLLAKASLDDQSDDGKNIAAVLAAASFEDVLRRLATDHASLSARVDLADVVTSLKRAGLLKGPQVGIAQSYLNFRNCALHGDWAKIDRSSVSSVLAFTEELLLRHYT
jgi:hypothetical protein